MSFSFTIPNTPPANKPTTNPPVFAFGNNNTATTSNTSSTTNTAPFTFGAQNPLPTPSTTTNVPSGFQFGGSTGGLNTSSSIHPSNLNTSTSCFNFGQQGSNTTAPTTTTGLLGQPSTTLGGGSAFSFGAPQSSLFTVPSATTGNIPQVAPTPAPFPRDTKFSELPPELKSSLQQIEKTIRENSSKLMLLPPPIQKSGKSDAVDFEDKLNQVQALLDSRRETLKELRRKMNYYWRYAENTAQALLASKSQTTDGRVIYKVPPMTPGLDPLERSVEELEAQITTLARLGTITRRRLEALLSPARPLEETIPTAIKAQAQCVAALAKKVDDMERCVGEEKEKYQAFLRKYRNFYQDPFSSLLFN